MTHGEQTWKNNARRLAIILDRRIPDLSGPWDDEPDHVEFEAHGFPCVIRRHVSFGTLCGYVGVREDHPLFAQGKRGCPLPAHGGVTWAGRGRRANLANGLWWFGFDTCHAWDLVPGFLGTGLLEHFANDKCVYRDLAYCRRECEQMAEALSKIKAEEAHAENN